MNRHFGRALWLATAFSTPALAQPVSEPTPGAPSPARSTTPTRPVAASSQTANQPKPTGEGSTLDEVVVTAQKRTERLRDVPLAVSAYTAATLQSLNISSATDLRQVSPSLNFNPSANARGEGFTVRGVGTAIFSDAIEQSVGVVVDGVPLARSGQATTELQDLDRVEVLRGPQGILFGKNASAGLISIVTRRPQLGVESFDGFFSYASRNEAKVQGTANLPLGDTAALRVSVASVTSDGLIYDKALNTDLNNRNEQIVRARILWQPNSRFSAYIIADAQSINARSGAWTARAAPLTTTFGALNAAAGVTPGVDNLTNAAGGLFVGKTEQKGLSAELNYDLGWANITSISAYRGWLETDNNDPDILPLNYLDLNHGRSNLRQQTQELRLASPGGARRRIDWVAGVFYEKLINSSVTDQAGTLGVTLPPGATLGTSSASTTDNESKAVYGQLTVRPLPRLKLLAGARYTDETVDLNYRQFATPGTIASIPGRYLGSIIGNTSDTNFSYRLTGQFDIYAGGMIYATYAKGYKGPGINTLGVSSPIPTVIAPEIPETYEVGARLGLPLHTVVNLAVFKTNFSNYQAQVFDQTVFPSVFRVTNAGRLNTKGVEAEIESRPLTGLTLGGSMTYLDATYGDFRNISCYAGQTVLPFGTPRTSDRQCILASAAAGATALTNGTGNPLTNAPEFSFNLRARYERPIGPLRAFAQANYYWRDDTFFSAAGDPGAAQKAYGLLGGSIGFGPDNRRWQLSLFAKNLTDEYYATSVFSQPVLNAKGVYSQFTAPDARRVIGVALSVSLGGA